MFRHRDHRHSTAAEARLCEASGVPAATPNRHDDPCVCGPYDRCWGVRVENARRETTRVAALRTLHRAYND